MQTILSLLALGTVGIGAGTAGHRRLKLSRAKHKSMAGHPRWSRRIAAQIPGFSYDPQEFFACDGAPDDVIAKRKAAFDRLAAQFAERFPKSRALTAEAAPGISDLQFTSSYRVPFPFAEMVRTKLGVGAFCDRSEGVKVWDLDGNAFYDCTGSYGVNLLGTDAYKAMIKEAIEQVGDLGPFLGALHPIVADNVARLTALTGLDEVSFHMSGTEAVMQAVRLARYHTGRTHLVRFCGAYHGWWGDVQPGIGNPIPADGTYTLSEMSERTLEILATKKNIACVLINPLQALHPNGSAPSDNQLVDGGRRAGGTEHEAYVEWLEAVAEVCRKRNIVLILDDVFTGFRLAKGGAAEYFGIEPDLVTFGKTLGGGLPIGAIVGKAELMRRYNPERPLDICFARGTFNSHPYVMAAMNAFLRHIDTPEGDALYAGLDTRWDMRAARMTAALAAAGVPVRIAHLSSIWTVLYKAPSRFNWMLQYYLRAEGLLLSWVGTGRLIFSLNYTDEEFDAVIAAFVRGCQAMAADGWFWHAPEATNKKVRRSVMKEALAKRLGR